MAIVVTRVWAIPPKQGSLAKWQDYLWKPMGPMGLRWFKQPSKCCKNPLGSFFSFEAVAMLQHLLDATPRGIYWGYLSARARALNLPHQTPETWLKNRATFEVVAPIVAE